MKVFIFALVFVVSVSLAELKPPIKEKQVHQKITSNIHTRVPTLADGLAKVETLIYELEQVVYFLVIFPCTNDDFLE